jgi:hypothetical protein
MVSRPTWPPPAPPSHEDGHAHERRQHGAEEGEHGVLEGDRLEEPAAREDQIQRGEDEHVGQRGAEEVAEADVGRAEQARVDVREDLRQGGARGQQERADPEPAEPRLLRDGVGRAGQPGSEEKDQAPRQDEGQEREERPPAREEPEDPELHRRQPAGRW